MITINANGVGVGVYSNQQQGSEQLSDITWPILGTNLMSLTDWSLQRPFLDIFKSSRAWHWDRPPVRVTTNLDSNGWLTSVTPTEGMHPNARISTMLITSPANPSINGRYVVLYDGQGRIDYRFGAVRDNAVSRPGRDVITITTGNNLHSVMRIVSTDPDQTGDYIRNIRMVPEEYENAHTNLYTQDTFNPSTAQIFNPQFLEQIRGMKVLRFMDWMRTNGSTQVNWSDRARLEDARWTGANGAPIEVMVALSNQTSADPWFNIPHMANDDYVRNFAQYVKNNIAPDRKVYVEYTNEGWNTSFPQGAWISAQTDAINQANPTQPRMHRLEWYARRSVEVINIWKETFGSESDRIVGVVAPQAASRFSGNTIVNYLKNNNLLASVDALAIAPYFGHYMSTNRFRVQLENMTVDNMFDEITQGGVLRYAPNVIVRPGGALQQAFGWMEFYGQLARDNNLELLAAEGGHHLAPMRPMNSNPKIRDLFNAVQNDPRMGLIYQQYLAKWDEVGGGAFVHFDVNGMPSPWLSQFTTPSNPV